MLEAYKEHCEHIREYCLKNKKHKILVACSSRNELNKFCEYLLRELGELLKSIDYYLNRIILNNGCIIHISVVKTVHDAHYLAGYEFNKVFIFGDVHPDAELYLDATKRGFVVEGDEIFNGVSFELFTLFMKKPGCETVALQFGVNDKIKDAIYEESRIDVILVFMESGDVYLVKDCRNYELVKRGGE